MENKIMCNGRYGLSVLMSMVLFCLLTGHATAKEPANSEVVDYKFINIKDSKFNFFSLKSKDTLKKYSKFTMFQCHQQILC